MAGQGLQQLPVALVKRCQPTEREGADLLEFPEEQRCRVCSHRVGLSLRGKVHFAEVALPGIAVHLVNKSCVTPPCRAPREPS